MKSAMRLLLLIVFIGTIEILKASIKGNNGKEGRKNLLRGPLQNGNNMIERV